MHRSTFPVPSIHALPAASQPANLANMSTLGTPAHRCAPLVRSSCSCFRWNFHIRIAMAAALPLRQSASAARCCVHRRVRRFAAPNLCITRFLCVPVHVHRSSGVPLSGGPPLVRVLGSFGQLGAQRQRRQDACLAEQPRHGLGGLRAKGQPVLGALYVDQQMLVAVFLCTSISWITCFSATLTRACHADAYAMLGQ